MNLSHDDELVDEDEIRAALKPWRLDSKTFASNVSRRIESTANEGRNELHDAVTKKSELHESDWLRIAASFVPIHLLGRNVGTNITPISFAAISLGNKLFVILAFPFLCFLMVGLTILGMKRIQAAQKEQFIADFDIEQAHQATKQWWRRYGWIATLVFLSTLAAPILGWTTPLMIALVCSGFAAVSVVRTLAKQNLVERNLIGGLSVVSLCSLGQVSLTLTNHTTQILDPNLLSGVLFAGAIVISCWVRPLAWTRLGDLPALVKHDRESMMVWLVFQVTLLAGMAYILSSVVPLLSITFVVAIAAYAFYSLRFQIHWDSSKTKVAIQSMILVTLLVVFTQSYWRGVSVSDIRKHVESFDGNHSGTWDDWADAAKWLNDLGGFEHRVSLEHFQKYLERNPQMRTFTLSAVARSGLLNEGELRLFTDGKPNTVDLTDPIYANLPIIILESDYFRIAAISQNLTDTEREVLILRLMVNWRQLSSNPFDYGRLNKALRLTELLNRLDEKTSLDQRRSDVYRWLVSRQVTKRSPFRICGGFTVAEQLRESDRRATLSAISLMENYGVPREINLPQLRAYLRPNFVYDFQVYDYVPKKIAIDKLNKLPGLPQPTLTDYLQSEILLWLSILLVLLLAYATWSSPMRHDHQTKVTRPIAV